MGKARYQTLSGAYRFSPEYQAERGATMTKAIPIREQREGEIIRERTPLDTKFPKGQLLMTRGVSDRVAEDTPFAKFVMESLKRHAKGDWGDMSQEDKDENDLALREGNLRLFSAYEHATLPKIWIITEADRSATTILFPEEY